MDLKARINADTKRTRGCCLWTGFINAGGYGEVSFKGRKYLVHRAAYELKYGPIPDGLLACHTCDKNYPIGDTTYRRCHNPDHIFLGTHADNMRDKAAKGRSARPHHIGEANARSKLTTPLVRSLRAEYSQGGVTIADLAARHDITEHNMRCAIRGLTWKHVDNPVDLGISRKQDAGLMLLARYPDPSLRYADRQKLYVREQRAADVFMSEIADAMGLTVKRVQLIAREAGVPHRPPGKRHRSVRAPGGERITQ